MMCLRHPAAVSHRGHCAACLLEEALAPVPSPALSQQGNLTIQVPLGTSAASSVFLVKGDGVRLLRLKTWHLAAPRDFMARFQHLQHQLSEWNHEAVPTLLAACVDGSGCPAVLSEFKQGIPIVERVESGGLDPVQAVSCWTMLLAAIRRAHERGLVHGSIVAGNIIVAGGGDPFYLLDFGHAALLAPEGAAPPSSCADLAGLGRLFHAVGAPAPASPRVL
jgi:serine/threonine protein kinase